MSRSIARIDTFALAHNLDIVRRQAPGSHVLAVIKANAYGHGLLTVAQALADADAFAVAHVDEALQLRQAGFSHRIVVLQGFRQREELELCSQHQLDVVVHHYSQVNLLKQPLPKPVNVWLKLNTGMNRLGFDESEFIDVFSHLRNFASVSQVLCMSHFACADRADDHRNADQLNSFRRVTDALDCPRSLANSGGILGVPDCQFDWVRPGIMLYGISPFNEQMGSDFGLRPVMRLSSEVIAVNHVEKGECVGYGGAWCAPRTGRLAVVSMGYGDGYPRHVISGAPVFINGSLYPIAGRISMDMLCVDIGREENIRPGDEVVLWGPELAIEKVAHYSQTIAYELTCKVTRRVKFQER